MLLPGQFISLAEETGLIVPLGRMVLHTALRDTVRWQRDHDAHSDLHIAVNVSGRQLQDPGIVEDVRLAIRASGIEPSTVVLEITESVLLPGDGVIVERLHALAALGVHLYIDDFGTGYSSLSYLQMLPVDGLKLAQEFVEQLPGTDSESGLVRTIRDLAGTLGLSAVVAEGIERPEQWRSLLSLGYSVGQGFHLAVPMPAERIPTFLSGLERPGDGDWERSVERAAHDAQHGLPGADCRPAGGLSRPLSRAPRGWCRPGSCPAGGSSSGRSIFLIWRFIDRISSQVATPSDATTTNPITPGLTCSVHGRTQHQQAQRAGPRALIGRPRCRGCRRTGRPRASEPAPWNAPARSPRSATPRAAPRAGSGTTAPSGSTWVACASSARSRTSK